MNTHEWNADDYSQNSQIQQKLARELIAKLSLNGSEDVLDLGCGDGKVPNPSIPTDQATK